MLFRGGGGGWGVGGWEWGVWECSVLNALNLEKQGVKIHKCALLLNFPPPFWLYHMHL